MNRTLLMAALLMTGIAGAAQERPPQLGQLPQGWVRMGFGPNALPGRCDVGVDKHTPAGVTPYLSVQCLNDIPSFGIATSNFSSERYNGRRVRISGWVRVANVEGVTSTEYKSVPGGAGLWVGMRSPSGGYKQNRMFDRSLNGTTDWVLQEVIVDIPWDGRVLMIGFWLQGKGQVWVRDLKVERVSKRKVPANFDWSDDASGLTLM